MKIAVLRALQLGDLLCSVPALRAVKAAHPEANVVLVGLPWAKQFAARWSRYLDGFVEFPGFPGMSERAFDAAALPGFLERMNGEDFELALQMHGSGRFSNPLVKLFGAKRSAGFYESGRYCPDRESFLEWRDEEPEVLRWLRLVSHLGMPSRGSQLEFPLADSDWREYGSLGLAGIAYAVVHPGSQLPSRRWPAERFAQVADALAMEGLRVVLTGIRSEVALTRRVAQAMREPAMDLAGRTSLGGFAAVVARARLVVANDTSVSHIAAATRTPSIIVACGSDPRRWAPLNAELHRVIAHPVECRPCAHYECPIGHPCALGVSVEEVLGEAWRLARCAA